MADIRKDDLSPANKDPVEGARNGGDASDKATPKPQESHLGRAGDPAEGRPNDAATGQGPR